MLLLACGVRVAAWWRGLCCGRCVVCVVPLYTRSPSLQNWEKSRVAAQEARCDYRHNATRAHQAACRERHTPPQYEPTNTAFPAACDSRQKKTPPALCIRRFCHCNHHLGGRDTLKKISCSCGGQSPTVVPCPRRTCGYTRATPGRRVEGADASRERYRWRRLDLDCPGSSRSSRGQNDQNGMFLLK